MIATLTAALLQASAAPAAPPAAAPPPPCSSEAHAGFDFWVGEWEVYPNGQETKIAESRIERKHNGCAVVESWMPLRGQGGTSLNHLDAATGRWHQKWVGSSPGAVEFSGGSVDGAMVLTGKWPTPIARHQLIRMSYTQGSDGSVRQHGEASLDHGLSWTTSFDLVYRPKGEEAE
ncbi:hypothetical protein ACXYL9_06890 [Qipengyuania sp. CAU 1752]